MDRDHVRSRTLEAITMRYGTTAELNLSPSPIQKQFFLYFVRPVSELSRI